MNRSSQPLADAATTLIDSQLRVSIVIPTYNRSERCGRLLRALAQQTLAPEEFEVIVVDDHSPDDTFAMLNSLVDELPYRLRPMRAEVNGGAGPARNIGWKVAAAPIIAFTDDDCMPEPQWLEAGIAAFAASPKTGVVQGRTEASNLEYLFATRWAHAVIVDHANAYFESCNIFYRREAIEDAGGFGVDYNWWSSPAWCEDTLAGWSALEAGWASDFADDALLTHDVESRNLKWWVKTSLSQYREVAIAKRWPEYREQTFWRPFSPRRHDAAFVLGVVGLATTMKWRPAALAAIPYLAWRRPSVSQGHFARGCVETVVIDAARTAGNLYGALRSRTFVV